MQITWIPLLVLLIGLLTFALAKNTDVKEIGRISFFVGLLVTVWHLAGNVLRL